MSSTLAILCASIALSATPAANTTKPSAAPVTAAATATPSDSKNSTAAAPAPATSGVTASTAAKPKPAADQLELYPGEAGVIQRTNSERARYGLRPLIIDRMLMRQARRHATWMTQARTLQHTSAPVAENIAMGQRSSSEAVQSWMNSSGHRANILNAGYTRIGVAGYTNKDGTTFWCQQFLH